MDSKKPHHDIVKALEKLDQDLTKIQEVKSKEVKQTKKKSKVKKVSREDVINKQNTENNKNIIREIKLKILAVILVFITTLVLTYSFSREERANLTEHVIFLFIFCGLLAAIALKR